MRSRWPAILAVVLALGALVYLFVRSGQRQPPSPAHLTQASKIVVRDETASVTLERKGAQFAYRASIDAGPERSGTVPAAVVEAFLAAAGAPDGGTAQDRRINVTISGIPDEKGTVIVTKLDPSLAVPYEAMIEAVAR